ncbi:integral membrane protein GPR137C [Trichomycterus rosablanca]|uniref:integral membrane protein GPR137C n=1 Tax=Trichomycterus rosablanca TaxID=2290929 RepID=UPI002F35E1F0
MLMSLEHQLRLGVFLSEDEAEEDEGSVMQLALTSVYTLLYCLLFFFIYCQLWLILHYGHKRLSYRSVFLILCLVWSALRTTLFSFYFNDMTQASQLQPLPFWLLYCFPVCLQFCTLCLLNLYFAQMMCKAKAKYSPELSKYKTPLKLVFLFISFLFLVVNVSCSLVVHAQTSMDSSRAKRVVLARVLVNDSLFVLCAVSLATCICKLARLSSASAYLESKGTTVCQATATGAAVVLLYTSRACYNLVMVAVSPKDRAAPFSYGWFSFSDQADVERISGKAYVVFGVVVFFWEFVPTALLVMFFRVQRPNQNLAPRGMIHSHSFNSRSYFFDNPRRYDSDDDLTRSVGSRGDRGSISVRSSTSQLSSGWYGSIQKSGSTGYAGSCGPHSYSGVRTSSAPLFLPCGGAQRSQHYGFCSAPQECRSAPQV